MILFEAGIELHVRDLKAALASAVTLVFIVVGLTDFLEFSGPVAALALGLVLGNLGGIARKFKWAGDDVAPARVEKIEMEFIGELVFLLKTFFFVFLGISMRPADLWSPTAFVIIGLLLLVRFVMVRFSLPGSIRCAADGSIVASLIPKGLAAAVMAAAAASEPDLPHGGEVENLIYSIILYSIATTALLVFLFEKTQVHRIFSGWWFRPYQSDRPSGGKQPDPNRSPDSQDEEFPR